MDTDWVLSELRSFVVMTALVTPPPTPGIVDFTDSRRTRASRDDVVSAAQVVEQVLDQVLPRWRDELPVDKRGRWQQHREAAQRAVTHLEREAEVRAKLGDDAPTISASQLHPWVWEGARSMWAVHSYDRAVEDALQRVNAETQLKAGRGDLGETKLFQQLFSPEAPKPGAPRLRLMPDDGTDTYRNRHLAVHALAQGLFAGLRNPAAHGVRASEGEEQIALERLAAVSILARWVDDATLVTAP